MTLNRVLVAYSSRPPIIEYLKRSFAKRGVSAEGVYADTNHWFDRLVIHHVNKTAHNLRILPKGKDWFTDHRLAHLNYRSSNLVKAVERFSPDLVFIVRGIRFRADALREVGSKALVFGWWIEREERMEEAFREADLYDHYFFMNSSCVEEGGKRHGAKVSLLPHSVDTTVFRPMTEAVKRYDWCFVGGWSKKRQEYIERAVEVSANGVVYGPKWIKKNFFSPAIRRVHKGDSIEGEDLVRLYNETRVVLNVTNWGLGEGRKRSGLNMRVLEVPACGACLLTDGSADLDRVVTPGRHVVEYEGLEGFASGLARLTDDGEMRNRVATEGLRHVSGNYTYDDVADIIIREYERIKGG